MGKWNKLGGRGGRGGGVGGGSGEEHMEGVKGEEEETAGCSFALWRAVLNVIVSEEIFFFFGKSEDVVHVERRYSCIFTSCFMCVFDISSRRRVLVWMLLDDVTATSSCKFSKSTTVETVFGLYPFRNEYNPKQQL